MLADAKRDGLFIPKKERKERWHMKITATYQPLYKNHMDVPRNQTFPLALHHKICTLVFPKMQQSAKREIC